MISGSIQQAQSKKAPANTIFGLIVLGTFMLCAVLGLIWTPYNPNDTNFSAQLQNPNFAHLLGTDNFGRDTLSRLLRSTSTSFMVGIISVSIGSSLGLMLGAIAGYVGGLLDDIIMRVIDAFSAFPVILMAFVLATILRPNIITAMIAVGLANVPSFTRLTRAGVLATKNLDYVDAAKALGATPARILGKYILPNLTSALIVQATFSFGVAILAEAALSYLGIGTQPPNPSWGVMLRDAQTFIYITPWPTIFPGVVIGITVLGFNALGDGLRDRSEPRGH